ncbi:hypothetical protein [Spirosoma radiotolerans]|uniref:Chemotaxis methyl-accepting receptor HlyB-like 4HB MCP domain-containing protein n=1 Tax=Spirosoma radiotolerans TaxID=1379870 RepID=A0A0E3V7Y5_9BACT|nr:hypothetical protein [Spirosoma radiotolerans]AKD55841.1 hypothetical protein SD10_13970 [Spirosoma radiotolerans]
MVTFIRKSLLNAYTALPLLICFVLASVNSFANTNKATRTAFLSGEELFQGVFFLEGAYAQMLPETQSLQTAYLNHNQSAAQKAAVSEVRQAVLAQIASAHPGYFAQFKSAMKSGDHLRVSGALAQGQQLVAQALDGLYKLDKAELAQWQAKAQAASAGQGGKLDGQAIEKLVAQMQKGKAVDANNGTCAVVAVVVLVVAVAAVWVAIALAAEEMISDNRNTKSLLHEQLVASICEVAPQIA